MYNITNIDIYSNACQLINRKQSKKIISWVLILILLLIMFSSFFFFYRYSKTLSYYSNLIEKEGEYYVYIDVDKSFTKNVIQKDILKIDNKIVKYEIVSIIDNYISDQLLIKLQLKQKPKQILKLEFILKETTLFEKIKERI